MKNIIKNTIEKMVIIPIPVFLIIIAILNYELGSLMNNINETYSQVSDFTRDEFVLKLVKTIALWAILNVFNVVFSKINNLKMINKNYMKWIEKLTYSKVSSITSIGTGGIANAISTIAQCDKYMVNTIINLLPYIIPFIIINKQEYVEAGIVPVIVNIVYITIIILANLFISNLKSNKIAAKSGAELRSCTTDCIYNSKTVKYFNKESWSINKQKDTQLKNFFDMVNIKKAILGPSIFQTITWIPSIVNVYLCWNNKTVVLFILMSDYVLNCISNRIIDFLDSYGDKKSNIKILGKLTEDNNDKKPLEKLYIKDVFFKYNEDSKVEFRIDDIVIEKGKRYCITGKSGFGKSTFIKLLTKTVEPISSNKIDSVDTIYMFAESEMFNTTIMENISLGDDSVSVEEVKIILNHLEVDLDLDIENDPIGEKGEYLSTGQRQRINLARVIVYARRHPGVLVALDEVTSALDEITSINCIKYLSKEFERLGTTLLYVSNKSDYKNTNLITDNIYVERNGDVVTYIQK